MPIAIQGMTPLLQVFDMRTSLEFYCGLLGFEIFQSDGRSDHDWVWLRRDGVELMLNTAYEIRERPPEPDPERIAAHRDVVFYFGAPDVGAIYEELRAHGVSLQSPAVTSYGMKQLHLRDPDGYALCFQWRADP